MSLFTQKELAKYSLTKALGEISTQSTPGVHGDATGLEREVHDTLAARLTDLTGAPPTGFLLPLACLKALNVTTATAGGFLVETELAAIVPALRSKSVAIAMGATLFENLHGTCAIPIESTTQTAQWAAEMEAITGSDSAYAQTTMTPRRVCSMATVSRQVLLQNSLGVENFMRDSILRTVGTALDKGALSGNGNAEPLGILNWSGTVTFGATATRAKAIAFQDALANIILSSVPNLHSCDGSKVYFWRNDFFSAMQSPTAFNPSIQPESSRSSSALASARSNIFHHIGFSSRRWKSTRSPSTTEIGSPCARSLAESSCRLAISGSAGFGGAGASAE
jgi:hypothetical protein